MLFVLTSLAITAHADQHDPSSEQIDIGKFPLSLVAAAEAAEDPNFRDRYLWRSPITMQVLQLLQPTKGRAPTDRLIEAMKLDLAYSHDEILAIFLNKAYFGRHCYGARAAAQGLLHKDLDEISFADAVMLAAVLRRPSGGFADDEFMRRNVSRITSELQEKGHIDSDQREQIMMISAQRTTALRDCR